MPVIASQDCGDESKTPLIATKMGSISQPKPYCKTWVCDNRECRRVKSDEYLNGDHEKVSKLRWIGWIPDKNLESVRKMKARNDAFMFTITFTFGDRLIASDIDLTPRTKLMVKRPHVNVVKSLSHEMIYGSVKAVSPAPPKTSRGGKLLHVGEPWPQYRTVLSEGFELKDGEIGDGFYDRKGDDKWTQEEVVLFVGGQLDTVKLIDRESV